MKTRKIYGKFMLLTMACLINIWKNSIILKKSSMHKVEDFHFLDINFKAVMVEVGKLTDEIELWIKEE